MLIVSCFTDFRENGFYFGLVFFWFYNPYILLSMLVVDFIDVVKAFVSSFFY